MTHYLKVNYSNGAIQESSKSHKKALKRTSGQLATSRESTIRNL